MLRIALIALAVVIAVILIPRLFSGTRAPDSGASAPDFTLASQEGSFISLKDYRGSWVVLYFYPKDQTPGCTREAHNFQVDQTRYAERHAVVLGVSVDSVDSHKKFCEKEGLNFKLLADPELKAITAYGSSMERDGVKMAARNTFLINPEGKIARVYTEVKPAVHSEEVLKDLAVLKKS